MYREPFLSKVACVLPGLLLLLSLLLLLPVTLSKRKTFVSIRRD